MARSVPPERWHKYVDLRLNGASRSAACSETSISFGTAKAFDRGDPHSTGHMVWRSRCRGREPFAAEARLYAFNALPYGEARNAAILEEVKGPIAVGPQNDQARMALDDFALFRPRYMGRETSPRQAEAAETILELLERREESYAVMNCPPGWGKSTLIIDIEAWLTARWRAIRGINGSRGEALAKQNTSRLKRTLERTTPLTGAFACLAADYGVFKPPSRSMGKWTDNEFIVYQDDGQPIEEKEPTWQSLGMDSNQLGNRANFISWDDLVDPRKDLRNEESINRQRDFLDDMAETRLESLPGLPSLFLLTMQRLGAEDLSRYCLDMRLPLDDLELIDTGEEDPRPRKYTHICFRAHDDDKCTGDHGLDAKPQPLGCLLDPKRLSWKKLRAIQEHSERKYLVQYQQEDLDPETVLVQRSWLNWDKERGIWSGLPENERGVSYVSVDPSGTKYWGVQAWHYCPDGDDNLGGRRYLLDLRDMPMQAPDLLDWNQATGQFVGLLEEWRRNFREIGRPLRCVVIEVNAFGRWLVQFDAATRWAQRNGVHFIRHTTGALKTDPDLGIWSHQKHWRHKRIILPGRTPADSVAVKPLVDQVCRWPMSARQDQVTSWWFGEHQMKQIIALGRSERASSYREPRPDFMLNPSAYLIGVNHG